MKLLQRTKEVEIKGVKFTIGLIKAFDWNSISARSEGSFPKLHRFIRETSKEDLEKMTPAEISARVFEKMKPDEIQRYNEDLFRCHWDMIKYGVRNHAGFIDEDGASEIPFKLSQDGSVEPDVIEAYHAAGLFQALGLEVQVFNSQRDVHKKNS